MSVARIHKILGGAGHMKDLLGPEGCRNIEPHLTLTCSAHRSCQSCIFSILFCYTPLCCNRCKWSSITAKHNTNIGNFMLHVSVQWAIVRHYFIKIMFLLSNAWWWFVLPKHVASNDNIKVLCVTVILHSYSVSHFQFYSETCLCVVIGANGVVLQPNTTLILAISCYMFQFNGPLWGITL